MLDETTVLTKLLFPSLFPLVPVLPSLADVRFLLCRGASVCARDVLLLLCLRLHLLLAVACDAQLLAAEYYARRDGPLYFVSSCFSHDVRACVYI